MLFTSLLDNSASSGDNLISPPVYACNCGLCCGAASNDLQGAIQPQFAIAPQQPAYSVTSTPMSVSGADAQTLMSGSAWSDSSGGRTVITYSFANAGSQYSADSSTFRASLTEFSAQDKVLTRALLDSIAAVCNVRFVEVADSGAQSGQVRYAYSQAPNSMGYAGFAYFPSTSEIGGDVWIGAAQASAQWAFYRPALILHETLHAIGLKHPFDGPNVLDTQSNIIPNTVMSYSPIAGSSNGSLSKYPAQPMPLDIAALQSLYGAASYNADNTVYNLADASFQSGFRALWDSAGLDTLDASTVGAGVALDLREGGRSDIGVDVNASATVAGTYTTTVYSNTLAIAAGVQIENAIGSGFGDTIIGNDWTNVLAGGAGNDMLVGGPGDDALDGGAGIDTATFTGSIANFKIEKSGDTIRITDRLGGQGTDYLIGIEKLQFQDRTVELTDLAGNAYSGTVANSFTAQTIDGLYHFFVVAFAAAPGVEYMDQLTDAYSYGLSLKEIVNIFTTKSQFTSVYPLTLTNQQLANQLVNNIVKSSATEQSKAEAVHDIQGALDIGWTEGDVIYQVFGNLATKPLNDPTWGNTALQFQNQTAVARYYTEVMQQSTTDLPILRAVVQDVTPFTDVSTPDAIATLIGVALSNL